MRSEVAPRFESDVAGWIHRVLLLEEEHQPLPEHPSPAMLVARVSERLSQAGVAIEDGRNRRSEGDLLEVGVFFIGAAAFAITAIAHTHVEQLHVVEVKDALLNRLDREVVESLEEDEDFYAKASPAALLTHCLSQLTEACQWVADLDGLNAVSSDDDDEHLLVQITESLGQTAAAAAAAGQRLVEHHSRSASRTPFVRAARGKRAATPSPPRRL